MKLKLKMYRKTYGMIEIKLKIATTLKAHGILIRLIRRLSVNSKMRLLACLSLSSLDCDLRCIVTSKTAKNEEIRLKALRKNIIKKISHMKTINKRYLKISRCIIR